MAFLLREFIEQPADRSLWISSHMVIRTDTWGGCSCLRNQNLEADVYGHRPSLVWFEGESRSAYFCGKVFRMSVNSQHWICLKTLFQVLDVRISPAKRARWVLISPTGKRKPYLVCFLRFYENFRESGTNWGVVNSTIYDKENNKLLVPCARVPEERMIELLKTYDRRMDSINMGNIFRVISLFHNK